MLCIGYDPGGDHRHGVAYLRIVNDKVVDHAAATVANVHAALDWFAEIECGEPIIAAGVDTLTAWSTGSGGWRPADRHLRAQYPAVRNSIASPNSLYGAMSISGMAFLCELRARHPHVVISETHPKVLYFALSFGDRYAFATAAVAMNARLFGWVGTQTVGSLATDHEWDALASAFAVYSGHVGRWTTDLHELKKDERESIVFPVGRTRFFWPESRARQK